MGAMVRYPAESEVEGYGRTVARNQESWSATSVELDFRQMLSVSDDVFGPLPPKIRWIALRQP